MTGPRPETPEPRANPDLLGQEAAEETLRQAMSSGRLAHAWLLVGPPGIGKATLAYRFARYLLSAQSRAEASPGLFGETGPGSGLRIDPADPVFRRLAAGAHPDVATLTRALDPKSGKMRRDIAVDEVRSITSFLHLTSAEGGWRIVVVDSADEMNANAANALLKILEEPPEQALLLLVSHRPGRLLPTLRSRCRQLALRPLPEAQVLSLLATHAPQLAEDDARALARLSEGSIGRALSLQEAGGLELYREIFELLRNLPRVDVPRVHAFGERLARDSSGIAFRTATELLCWWLARMIHSRAASEETPEVVEGETALMLRLAEGRGLARWLALWEKLTISFARAEQVSLDRKQVVVTAFLQLEAVAA